MTNVAAILSEPVANSRRALLRTPIVTQVLLACATVSGCPPDALVSALYAEQYSAGRTEHHRTLLRAAREACAYALRRYALLSPAEIQTLLECRPDIIGGRRGPLVISTARAIRRQLMRDRA